MINEDFKEKQQIDDLIVSILILFLDYVNFCPNAILKESFHEDMISDVHELLTSCCSCCCCTTYQFIEVICNDIFYEHFYERRSYNSSFATNMISPVSLKELQMREQPTQRTPEWYTFRHNLITASNAYKMFGSESLKNSLIVEKCEEPSKHLSSSVSMHHGVKYEPVSIMFYEFQYQTKVGEFGCIQHPVFKHLGASPDGINILETSDRYKRMLEIKNVFSRVITGIPKLAYWVQMQLQMEVCDLDETDFLETQFQEYKSCDEFLLDSYKDDDNGDSSFIKTSENHFKGIILATEDGQYLYKPLLMEKKEYEEWLNQKKTQENVVVIDILYWKLIYSSCVLVKRNKTWFSANIDHINSFWDTILRERSEGYAHRLPKEKRHMQESFFPSFPSVNSLIV